MITIPIDLVAALLATEATYCPGKMTEHTKCKLSQQVEEVVTTQNGHPVKLDNLPTCITIATFSWAAPAAVVDCDCGTGR